MVKIALQLKATVENIEEFRPSGSDFNWYLKFTCCNCGEVSGKWNYASLKEEIRAERGGVAVNHFASKCKLCSRENSMSILKDTVKPYIGSDESKFQTIAVFDCRGLEPSDFAAREGWIAKAVNNGKEFVDVDLSDGEWADYCDRIKEPVGIYEIEHRFERIK